MVVKIVLSMKCSNNFTIKYFLARSCIEFEKKNNNMLKIYGNQQVTITDVYGMQILHIGFKLYLKWFRIRKVHISKHMFLYMLIGRLKLQKPVYPGIKHNKAVV